MMIFFNIVNEFIDILLYVLVFVGAKLVQMKAETKGKMQVFHFGYAECSQTCTVGES